MTTNITKRHPHLKGLRAELLDHIDDDEFLGPTIRHPLVLMPVSNEETVRFANDLLENKTDAVLHCQAAGDWERVLLFHERPYRLKTLTALAESGALDSVSVNAWAGLVRSAWTDTESRAP